MTDPIDQSEHPARYDVVILGGAFSGAATAVMLKRWRPATRILLIERTRQFSRKVGEATVEVSGLFISRVLGLDHHLAHEHLPKHGLRFWFDHGRGQRLEDMGELGPKSLPSLASFHLDRAKLDQHLLDVAQQLGVEVLRPAKITDVDLAWPESSVSFEPPPPSSPAPSQADPNRSDEGTPSDAAKAKPRKTIRARWVVDASGRNTFLGRRLGLIDKLEGHPIAAAWARWDGVADLEGQQVLGPDPRVARLNHLKPSRALSTNHFCGYGWWAWVIPLSSGQTSIGLVYDTRLFEPPGLGKIRDRYHAFVRNQPGLSQLLEHARMDERDFHAYKHLPYRCGQYMDRGWAIVGDAAAFLDPLYSSGLDHAAISTYATARILDDDLAGQYDGPALDATIAEHNEGFARSYDRWFEAIYQDKYALFGDPDLVAASYFLDIGSYYLGVVKPVYAEMDEFRRPVLGLNLPQARIAHHLMRGLKARFLRLAETRRRLGITAQTDGTPPNLAPRRRYGSNFDLGEKSLRIFGRGLAIWIRTELATLGHRLQARGQAKTPQPSQQKIAAGLSPDLSEARHASQNQSSDLPAGSDGG